MRLNEVAVFDLGTINRNSAWVGGQFRDTFSA